MGTNLCGNVVCGFPSPGEEVRDNSLDFNEFLIKHRSCTFCLRAYGDSMAPMIKNGDILVVDRSLAFHCGDIVVAQCNGDFTVKYIRKDNGNYFLEAENSSYSRICVSSDTVIFGVVTAVVRKTRS